MKKLGRVLCLLAVGLVVGAGCSESPTPVSPDPDPSYSGAGSSGNLSWDDWCEDGEFIEIINPQYNGVMLNTNPVTLERFCTELNLVHVSTERTWYSGDPDVNENHMDPSYGYQSGRWEAHPCSYDDWHWDDCASWPSKIVARH